MNQADSEKIHMVLLQSGFLRVNTLRESDLVIFNTCSVRQKWEDRVFGILREIGKINKDREEAWNKNFIISGVTGCMVRKTGMAKKYLGNKLHIRKKAKKIEFLEKTSDIFNNDDKLFPRSPIIDFVLRIEETKYLPLILTEIYGEKIGQEDRFDDYLKQVQQRENPASASVIIQTGCDNYCSFCIVPYTRGWEISRDHSEIISECKNAVENGAKEITLLGQNVNSYGKQKNLKLWNSEKSRWNNEASKLKIGIDLDDTLFVVLCQEVLNIYNKKYSQILWLQDIVEFDCNGIPELMEEYHNYEKKHALDMKLHTGWSEVLKSLREKWHELHIITSRPPETKISSLKLLEKNYGKNFFTSITFIKESWHDNKYEAANKLHLDIVIDDGPHHIESYKKHFSGKICIFTQWWNKHITHNNSQVFRIHDWYDFEKLLPKIQFQSPFRSLLEDIDTTPWLDRIRFTSSNPHDMTRDILDAHFDLKSTCNYLHFALQSGSTEMLKKMNRRHSYEDFRDMVYYLREKDPLFSISTDIIVGFSGETEEMFQETIKAFEECIFDFAYIARYSVRPNTAAAKVLPDDVPDSVKAERWHILNEILLKNITKRNTLMLWTTQEILISSEKEEFFSWRTRNFKEVFIAKDEKIKFWDIINVKITEMDRYVLRGKQI